MSDFRNQYAECYDRLLGEYMERHPDASVVDATVFANANIERRMEDANAAAIDSAYERFAREQR